MFLNMKKLIPYCKLWLVSERNGNVFGDGKFRLLQAIGRYGSLQKACRELEISYRKAWADLKKAESCLQSELVTRSRGGSDGGRMKLTAEGRKVLSEYSIFSRETRKAMQSLFAKMEKKLMHD